MAARLNVGGTVASGFEGVGDAFAKTIDSTGRAGAAVSIRVGGQTVVDLWGGSADSRSATPWTQGTTSVIFSATKGLITILVARLVQEGLLRLDEPVATYWPEFAKGGKESVSVDSLLSHRAGLSAPREDLSTDDILNPERIVSALEFQQPLWIPGTAHAYHALTYGWLVGELVRRVTGRSIGQYFEDTIAKPLGVDAWIGLPEGQQARVAHLELDPSFEAASGLDGESDYWIRRSVTLGHAFPPLLITDSGGFNDPRVRAAEIAAGGGITTARGLATIWSAVVTRTDDVLLLDSNTIAEFVAVRSAGAPFFRQAPPFNQFGAGFMLNAPPAVQYLAPTSFGHDGAGGQVAFADPVREVGFAYITNLLGTAERASRVVDALREVLGMRPLP